MLIGQRSKVLLFSSPDSWSDNIGQFSSVWPTNQNPARRIYFTSQSVNDTIKWTSNLQVIDKHISSGSTKEFGYSTITITAPLYYEDFKQFLGRGMVQNGNAFDQRPPGEYQSTCTIAIDRGFTDDNQTKWEIYKGCCTTQITINFVSQRFATATYTIRGIKESEYFTGDIPFANIADQPLQNVENNEFSIDGLYINDWINYSVTFNFNQTFIEYNDLVGYGRPLYGVMTWNSTAQFTQTKSEFFELKDLFKQGNEADLQIVNTLTMKGSGKISNLISQISSDSEYFVSLQFTGQGDNFFIGEKKTYVHLTFNVTNPTLPLFSSGQAQVTYDIDVSTDGMNSWTEYTGTYTVTLSAPNKECWIRPHNKSTPGWLNAFNYGVQENQNYRGQITLFELLDYDGVTPFTIQRAIQTFPNTRRWVFMPRTFYQCTNLKKVVMWDSSTVDAVIDETDPQGIVNGLLINTFEGCTSLVDVDMISVIRVNTSQKINLNSLESTFLGCSQMKSITSVTEILCNNVNNFNYLVATFSGCSSLLEQPEITISIEGTGSLGYLGSTFSGCSSLVSVQGLDLDLPTSYQSYVVFGSLFYNCTSLESLEGYYFGIPGNPDTLIGFMTQSFYNCSKLTKPPRIGGIPQSVEVINNHMYQTFYKCSSLEDFPEFDDNQNNLSITTLTGYFQGTFYDCSRLKSGGHIPDLGNYVGTNNITQFLQNTFGRCTSMTTSDKMPTLTINSDCAIQSFMQQCFNGCSNLLGGDYIGEIVSNNALIIDNYCYQQFSYNTKMSSITIPSLPNSTTRLNNYLSSQFSDSGLTSIVFPALPASVTSLQNYLLFTFGFSKIATMPQIPQLPSGVTNIYRYMYQTFQLASSLGALSKIPSIPATVTNATDYLGMCFYQQTNISGTLQIGDNTQGASIQVTNSDAFDSNMVNTIQVNVYQKNGSPQITGNSKTQITNIAV